MLGDRVFARFLFKAKKAALINPPPVVPTMPRLGGGRGARRPRRRRHHPQHHHSAYTVSDGFLLLCNVHTVYHFNMLKMDLGSIYSAVKILV